MGEGRHGPPGVQALGRAWPACRGIPRRQLLAAGQHLGSVGGAAGAMAASHPTPLPPRRGRLISPSLVHTHLHSCERQIDPPAPPPHVFCFELPRQRPRGFVGSRHSHKARKSSKEQEQERKRRRRRMRRFIQS